MFIANTPDFPILFFSDAAARPPAFQSFASAAPLKNKSLQWGHNFYKHGTPPGFGRGEKAELI
jgi:hypothetical protein